MKIYKKGFWKKKLKRKKRIYISIVIMKKIYKVAKGATKKFLLKHQARWFQGKTNNSKILFLTVKNKINNYF